MRLLLLEDVRKLGHVGDIVEVKSGYGRNYLLPQRLAAEPTQVNIKAIEEKRKVAAAERSKRLKEFSELAERMKDVSITIEAVANPEGTLYGAVREKDIADANFAAAIALAMVSGKALHQRAGKFVFTAHKHIFPGHE